MLLYLVMQLNFHKNYIYLTMINIYNKQFLFIIPVFFLTPSKEIPFNYQKKHIPLVIYL
jgi:hypothetical protein